ncbi:MAG: hypothetical protein SGPRY_004426 [Prymnesium sp.]
MAKRSALGRIAGGGGRGRGVGKAARRSELPTLSQISRTKPQQARLAAHSLATNRSGLGAQGGGGRHTILLQQETAAQSSRKWNDFDSIAQALDFFTDGYERELRKLNPDSAQLSYTVAGTGPAPHLHIYIDSLHDLSMLVADPQTGQYAPKGKAQIKQQLMQRIQKSAAK